MNKKKKYEQINNYDKQKDHNENKNTVYKLDWKQDTCKLYIFLFNKKSTIFTILLPL